MHNQSALVYNFGMQQIRIISSLKARGKNRLLGRNMDWLGATDTVWFPETAIYILSFWSLKVQKRTGRVASSKVESVGGKVAQVSGRQNWKF